MSDFSLNLLWHMYKFQLFYVESALSATGTPVIRYLHVKINVA